MAIAETYEEFVDKFKPKRTTDDCYTPEGIYDVVRDYVIEKYDLQVVQLFVRFGLAETTKNLITLRIV